jgi:hypothetical protein
MVQSHSIPNPEFVERVYRRAVEDETRILRLWPDARAHKRTVVSELGFSLVAETWSKKPRAKRPAALLELAAIRVNHRDVIRKNMPQLGSYRPSELVIANLNEAWIPYADLLLQTVRIVDGADFAELKPQLEKLCFEKSILNLFQPTQKRKYLLQQTSASVATMIVARRHPRRIGSEESVRTAQKMYTRIRSRLETQN